MAASTSKRLHARALRTAGLSARSNVRIERDYNSVKPQIIAYAQSLASMLQGIPGAGAVRAHVMDAAELIAALTRLPPAPGDTPLTQQSYLGLVPGLASLSVIYADPGAWPRAHQAIADSLNIHSSPTAYVNLNRAAPFADGLEEQGCAVAHGDTHFPLIVYTIKTSVEKRPIQAAIRLVHELDDMQAWLAGRIGANVSDAMAQPLLLSLDRAAGILARIASLFGGGAPRVQPDADQALVELREAVSQLPIADGDKARLQALAEAIGQGMRMMENAGDIWAEMPPPLPVGPALSREPVLAAPAAPPAAAAPQAAEPRPEEPVPRLAADAVEQPPLPDPDAPSGKEKNITLKDTMYFHRPGEGGIVDTLELIRKALDEVQSDQKKNET